MTTTTPETALLELGFTEIEALLFCELTRLGPSTGYRLAKAVGKAAANTYQALETLAQKGAVLVDEGESKTWRAAPATELIAQLSARFEQRSRSALTALAELKAPEAEARLYTLRTPDQVLARARGMIAAAKSVLLFDLFPGPFELLEPDLAQAAARGVRVLGQVYTPVNSTVPTISQPTAPAQLAAWPGLQVTVVADGIEHLSALLSRDGRKCRHGVWSDSPYLACLHHSGLAAEIGLGAHARGEPLAFDPSLFGSHPPGLDALTSPASGD
ncbi:TrmB family transcriptional regulator [Phenylobacterium sp.]|uniref:TrmB family transcriptional regulator n=1 Tax=Phenylobacterium sp. TaxID=1871053 RepID=UPI0025FA6AE7|nr:helix-turn-helix domain-containing protein [Phenylobacterium sp.]